MPNKNLAVRPVDKNHIVLGMTAGLLLQEDVARPNVPEKKRVTHLSPIKKMPFS